MLWVPCMFLEVCNAGVHKTLSSCHLGNLIWYGGVEYFQHNYWSFLPFIEDCVSVHMHQAQLRVLSMGLHLCHSPGAKNLVFGCLGNLCTYVLMDFMLTILNIPLCCCGCAIVGQVHNLKAHKDRLSVYYVDWLIKLVWHHSLTSKSSS